MSLQLINQYYSKLERVVQYGGSRHEQSVRGAFQQLLESYANTQNSKISADKAYSSRDNLQLWGMGQRHSYLSSRM